MQKKSEYYVVKQKAVPEVLLKVVEAKKLLESGKAATIQDAVEKVDISRSSFYKYKDDIFPFHDNTQGTTITLSLSIDDEPGLLSDLLKVIADFGANILTIHQSIPINGVASLSISVQVLCTTSDVSRMLGSVPCRLALSTPCRMSRIACAMSMTSALRACRYGSSMAANTAA